MRWLLLLVLAGVAVMAGCANKSEEPGRLPAEAGQGRLPMGSLGFAVGTYLMLEGTTFERIGKGARPGWMRVTEVNGVKLKKPVEVVLTNASLPVNQHVVVKGFENLVFGGEPEAVIKFDQETRGDKPEDNWSLAQRGYTRMPWWSATEFVVLKVVYPEGVEAKKWEPTRVGAPAQRDDVKVPRLTMRGEYFGLPLGEYVTIEGSRGETGWDTCSYMKVTKVNGRPLKEAEHIWLDNLWLPEKGDVVIKGFATMSMIGMPPAYHRYDEEMGQELRPTGQIGYGPHYRFVVLRVVSPEGLEVKWKRGTK